MNDLNHKYFREKKQQQKSTDYELETVAVGTRVDTHKYIGTLLHNDTAV